jgi:hypothetical protein
MAELQRFVRPGLIVVVAFVVYLSIQGLQSIHTRAAGEIDLQSQRDRFCASQPFRPVECDTPLAVTTDPAVTLARTYETPLGRLHLVMLQLGSTAGVVGFGVLAAAAAASDWGSGAVRLRRQLHPSGVTAGLLPAAAAALLAVPVALVAFAALLLTGGPWGQAAPDVSMLARDAAAAAFVVFVAAAVGTCLGQIVGNPLGAAGLYVGAVIAMNSISSSPPVINPAHAIAALMHFDGADGLVQDRMWGINATASASAGALVLVGVLAAALALHALSWRRKNVLT